MEICELKKNDEKAWDEYVLKHPDSTFYHQIGWKYIVEKSYGHKPHYLFARENGEINGVLPLFIMKSSLFGKKLVSLPFAPYGGSCYNDEYIKNMLIQEAINVVQERDMDFLELRHQISYDNNKLLNKTDYITYVIDLENEQTVWEKIKRDRQRNIQKGSKNNLELNWDASVDDFYEIHSHTMRDLGTPSHSIQFFKNCISEFPNNSKVLSLKYSDKLIGCQILFFFKDTIIAAWGSSIEDYKNYMPDQFTIWEILKYGCSNGFRHFDFGRCLQNTSAFKYKERWGGYPKQLLYQYYIYNTDIMPDNSQSNPKRQKFSNLWKKLPIPITEILGPIIRKHIP